MELRKGERVYKIFHHHPTPFMFKTIRVMFMIFPFFFFLYLIRSSVSNSTFFWLNFTIFVVFALVMFYISFVYWMDRLVVTNQRVIYIDWRFLTVRHEVEAFLNDIQDIKTRENGVLSIFWLFDYGLFKLDTSSSRVTIVFEDAPDPEGVRRYIFHVKQQ